MLAIHGLSSTRRPASTVSAPRGLTRGVETVAEIWRRGERFGPRGGLLVGRRYRVDEQFEVDATRRELRLRRKDGEPRPQRDRIEPSPRANDHEVSLEPGEEEFVDALVDLFRRPRCQTDRF